MSRGYPSLWRGEESMRTTPVRMTGCSLGVTGMPVLDVSCYYYFSRSDLSPFVYNLQTDIFLFWVLAGI